FFFSSRRRHTRFSRDWSSDVCSSDLEDVVDFAFDVQVVGDVVVDEPEPAVLEEVVDVAGLAGDQVVDGGDLRPRLDQGGAHVGRSEERRVGKEWRSRGAAAL